MEILTQVLIFKNLNFLWVFSSLSSPNAWMDDLPTSRCNAEALDISKRDISKYVKHATLCVGTLFCSGSLLFFSPESDKKRRVWGFLPNRSFFPPPCPTTTTRFSSRSGSLLKRSCWPWDGEERWRERQRATRKWEEEEEKEEEKEEEEEEEQKTNLPFTEMCGRLKEREREKEKSISVFMSQFAGLVGAFHLGFELPNPDQHTGTTCHDTLSGCVRP